MHDAYLTAAHPAPKRADEPIEARKARPRAPLPYTICNLALSAGAFSRLTEDDDVLYN